MKTLYLECKMGAAGDMLMGSLLELIPDAQEFFDGMKCLEKFGIEIEREKSIKCGISGTHMKVLVNGRKERGRNEDDGHEPYHYSDLKQKINELELPEPVKKDVLKVYQMIGEAEAEVHNTDLKQIHFHEVGSLDALADITGVCLLIYLLKPERILASPVYLGNGTVRCAHGILPVPVPAVANLLRGIPTLAGEIQGELCTPTGAALIKYYAQQFCLMPQLEIEKIGYGMGTRDFLQVNCLRAFWGNQKKKGERMQELVCNLDDMTPEAIAYAGEVLREQGAWEVYTTPVFMKKNRQACMLTCLCAEDKKEEMIRLMLLHTTTLGVRCREWERNFLCSHVRYMESRYGNIRIKESKGYGIEKNKAEYEDIKKAAKKEGVPFSLLQEEIQKQMIKEK